MKGEMKMDRFDLHKVEMGEGESKWGGGFPDAIAGLCNSAMDAWKISRGCWFSLSPWHEGNLPAKMHSTRERVTEGGKLCFGDLP